MTDILTRVIAVTDVKTQPNDFVGQTGGLSQLIVTMLTGVDDVSKVVIVDT